MTGQSTVYTAASAEVTAFDEQVAEMVADQVPRVFAVVHVYGECVGAEVVAWGMAFDDGV